MSKETSNKFRIYMDNWEIGLRGREDGNLSVDKSNTRTLQQFFSTTEQTPKQISRDAYQEIKYWLF